MAEKAMRGWFEGKLPTREGLLANRWISPFAHRLADPVIWHWNRRSLARGVALGLFAGLLVPIGQTPVAALAALSVRANVIVAAVATLVTNPLTVPPIYFAAYRLGRSLLGEFSQVDEGALWLLKSIYGVVAPTALGLLMFGVLSAAAGYWLAHLLWRWRVVRRWRRRAAVSQGRMRKEQPSGATAAHVISREAMMKHWPAV